MSILSLLASDGFLSVNKTIARAVGLDAAVVLAELASAYNYWEAKGELTEDGMFYETAERIEENTTLSKYQQAKAIKVLEDAGIVTTKKAGIPAKKFFAINEDKIIDLLNDKKLKNLTTGSKKTLPQEVKKLNGNKNIEEESKKEKRERFIKPTVDEIRAYCKERRNDVDPERFFNYYESKGWLVGRANMKDWRAAVRTWERRSNPNRKRRELEEGYDMLREWAGEG